MENDVLISMNALKRFIQENGVVYSNKLDKFAVKDAVRVVRCKDCKWYQIRSWDENKPNYDCRKTQGLIDVKPDDFCSYGERKENL